VITVGINYPQSDFKAQSISDAVAISTAVNQAGLSHLFNSLTLLTDDLLSEGYFIRGAVVRGRLYHDDRMVFGEALVDAFNLEANVVRYPRIMLRREVALDCKTYGIEAQVKQAHDGPLYLHTLNQMVNAVFLDCQQNQRSRIEVYERARHAIQRRFDEAVDNPRHFEKV
jgi:hypothetical protein